METLVNAAWPNVLLVEDDEADRSIFLRAAERGGMRANIRLASDGKEALDYLLGAGDQRKDGRASIVLLDLNIPGMSGFELLAKIRAARETKSLPIIVLTTSDSMDDVMKCYEAGANSFITKPTRLEKLIDVVVELDRYWLNMVTLPAPAAH